VVLTNSTVSNNTALELGGGISDPNNPNVVLTNSTVSNNTAPLRSDCSDLVNSSGYNIESPGDTCGFEQPTDEANVSAEDLQLGPLQDNGGPTETHALGDGSVAIDQIPEEDCVNADGEPLTTDQRGESRDSMCDIGAFELQP
jgi:hypothetical protein